MLKVLAEKAASEEPAFGIDEICREGARRMLAVALEAEVDAYVAEHLEDRDDLGHRLVVRNGRAETRTVKTVASAIEVTAPRVDDKRVDGESGERQRFHSSILLPWCRHSQQVSAVLPLLYLHGLSTGDFVPALSEFFGDGAGLSGPVVARLTRTWQDEQEAFASRSLAEVDYVYIWVDGIHFNVRLGEDRLCCLVVVGVRADGRKELVAITGGYRESTESWASLLRDCKRRGMRAPVLAVGDGALGFWAAVRDVFPETTEQRCWFHVSANVLNALPKSVQPAARRALAEIRDAEDKAHAEAAVKAFADEFKAKWPKAVAKITDKPDALLAFYDMPAEHWVHLKTTNNDRVDLCHGSPPHQGHQGRRVTLCRTRHGLQARRHGREPLAGRQRAPPRRSRPCWRALPQRRARRALRGGGGVNSVRNDTETMACAVCGTAFRRSGRRLHCSDACRQAAWRRRSQAPREPIVAKPDTVYQCPMCEVRLIGEQYCEECHSFARRLGPGGTCPCCDEPISVTELLQPEQFAARKGQKTTRGR